MDHLIAKFENGKYYCCTESYWRRFSGMYSHLGKINPSDEIVSQLIGGQWENYYAYPLKNKMIIPNGAYPFVNILFKDGPHRCANDFAILTPEQFYTLRQM
jgi:hypothetical protein